MNEYFTSCVDNTEGITQEGKGVAYPKTENPLKGFMAGDIDQGGVQWGGDEEVI